MNIVGDRQEFGALFRAVEAEEEARLLANGGIIDQGAVTHESLVFLESPDRVLADARNGESRTVTVYGWENPLRGGGWGYGMEAGEVRVQSLMLPSLGFGCDLLHPLESYASAFAVAEDGRAAKLAAGLERSFGIRITVLEGIDLWPMCMPRAAEILGCDAYVQAETFYERAFGERRLMSPTIRLGENGYK